jgi:SAM-dependent methyltransferase/GNAT superfamily N-acetyltransferase
MINEIQFSLETQPNEKDDAIVRDGINNFNNSLHNDPVSHHSIFAKLNGEVVGGALIYQHVDAIYIDSLWVDEKYRNQGVGSTLLKKAEQDALEKGILKQVICTFHEPNMQYYKNRGFELIATVPEYIHGMDKYYLRKIANKDSVKETYDKLASWFDEARTKDLSLEEKVLSFLEKNLSNNAKILDVGCGTGEPIARFFIERNYQLTGIDNSQSMLSYCRDRFPDNTWICMDMRKLALNQKFDCIIAWHSFFHIQRNEQESVLRKFSDHLNTKGFLVFTSGVDNGEIWSNNGGEMLFHASLSPDEYKMILEKLNMNIVMNTISDPECGGATIWIAKKEG